MSSIIVIDKNKGYKSQIEVLKANKERAYKEYKGYTFDIIRDNMIRVNDSYDLFLSKDNNWICSCHDFVYRSGHYSEYYCKHIFGYLFTAASRDNKPDIVLPNI